MGFALQIYITLSYLLKTVNSLIYGEKMQTATNEFCFNKNVLEEMTIDTHSSKRC